MLSSSTDSELDALIGLGSAKRVVRALGGGKISTHAVLFYGGEGSGTVELSRILARAWLCRGECQAVPGTLCAACHAFVRDRNPDLHFIGPQGSGNLITIKQMLPRPADGGEPVLSMQEFLRTPPLISRSKVVFISEADRMNSASANSLLKTLEEPPKYTKLILTTYSTGAVLPTILSRVLAVGCALPDLEEIQRAFPAANPDEIEMAEFSPGRLEKILRCSGAYRQALEFGRSLAHTPVHEALAAAEAFRSISEALDKQADCGSRLAQQEVLRVLGRLFVREAHFPAWWTTSVVRAHDQLGANVNGTLVADALFARLLGGQPAALAS